MPKPYSYDLRQKVINAIVLDGMKKTEVAQVFQISRNTINLWLQRQAETGDYQPKPTRPQRINTKIPDLQEFSQFAQIHGDKTQAQMAELWLGEISPRTISRGLKKIGWTREKKRRCLKKAEGRGQKGQVKRGLNPSWLKTTELPFSRNLKPLFPSVIAEGRRQNCFCLLPAAFLDKCRMNQA